ncbi:MULTISPECIES: thioredoxin TrxC [unclassified Pseudomonas]|uniref:thioredoxin TrxC n=1 Tax=unclassified Pseudomonas TaxID=196821 RepID=UPI00244C12AD|nr:MULTISPECIES: thioredoxin TrxC [unclassified Pseudomonas]MDH0304204.1 thioredoxin TrxC [Pseudomonas sp. GD04091]MDH1986193.1 thioredoxin TrxC [Pseudomonas sp. GD03689]
MSDPLVIPCPHCNGLSRLPAERLGDSPKCGRCKQDMLLPRPFDLSEASYSAQIKGDLPLLLDVWADWCGPCKSFAPVFEQAARQLNGRCRLAKLDSEANRNLAGQLGIRSIPSLILFRNGREVARQAGAFPLQSLLEWLRGQGV